MCVCVCVCIYGISCIHIIAGSLAMLSLSALSSLSLSRSLSCVHVSPNATHSKRTHCTACIGSNFGPAAIAECISYLCSSFSSACYGGMRQTCSVSQAPSGRRVTRLLTHSSTLGPHDSALAAHVHLPGALPRGGHLFMWQEPGNSPSRNNQPSVQHATGA